jgi:hypothetical protein
MSDRSAFDLFSGLASLSRGDKSWFQNLSPEGQKAAAPFVMARWMTGTSDAQQILRINTFVNPFLFTGTTDKSGLFKLMAVAATGKNARYSWLKGPGPKSKKLSLEVIKQYYECSTREANTYRIDAASLLEMAEECGWEKDEIAKLKKEVDDGSGTAEKASVKPAKPSKRR